VLEEVVDLIDLRGSFEQGALLFPHAEGGAHIGGEFFEVGGADDKLGEIFFEMIQEL
jgi:hypothetical protein